MSLNSSPIAPFWFLDNRVEVVAARKGEFSLLEMTAYPGDMVPLHLHHGEDEVFSVLEGEITLVLDGKTVVIGPGQSASVSRGLPHSYRVTSKVNARWLVLTTPGAFGDFVQAMSRPAASEGLPVPAGPPTPEQMAGLAEVGARHRVEILGPPPFAP